MRTYRKIVGWTVRVLVAPVLVVYLISLFLAQLIFAVAEASTRWVLEFAARVEEWETAEPAPEWRPLREAVVNPEGWVEMTEQDSKERLDS